MEKFYAGIEKIDGGYFDVSENPNEERRPFKAIMDSGLFRTTTGARIFGAMKGAIDGGLYIPHSEKRFPGFTKAKDEGDKN